MVYSWIWVAKTSALPPCVASSLSGTDTLEMWVCFKVTCKQACLVVRWQCCGCSGVLWWWWRPQWFPNMFLQTSIVCVCWWGPWRASETPEGVLKGYRPSWMCCLPFWRDFELLRKIQSWCFFMKVLGIEVFVRRGAVRWLIFVYLPSGFSVWLFLVPCIWWF